MDLERIFGRVEITWLACASVVLLSLNCSSGGQVGGSGAGNGGQSGKSSLVSSGSAGGAAGGSTGTDDAAVASVRLDVPAPWWGPSDAPQLPEVPVAPSFDSNCGTINSHTVRQPADVLLVLDRSASMEYSIAADCYCTTGTNTFGTVCTGTTACTTRWDAIKPAVSQTLSSSSDVNWGLKFFPSPSTSTTGAPSPMGGPSPTGAGSCFENSTMDVAVAPTSVPTITSDVNSATFDLSTPTAAALTAATAYLSGLNDGGNKKFILLATDGQPNCGGNPASINTDDLAGATTAAAAAYAAGFKVYVVGIGPSLGNLTQLAKAGGTTDFYPVSSPADLVAALSSISTLVGSCSFKSDHAPDDPSNIAVYVNGQQVSQDPNQGWTFGASSQEIVLTGDYCKQMSSGNQVDVQILFGCQGQPPNFPPKIY